jgi:hypothetical protein
VLRHAQSGVCQCNKMDTLRPTIFRLSYFFILNINLLKAFGKVLVLD